MNAVTGCEPSIPPAVASVASTTPFDILEVFVTMRALERKRAQLRELRQTLVVAVALAGFIPALGAAAPSVLLFKLLTIVWAACALAWLIAGGEELLLALDRRRLWARLSRRTLH